ncbi:hypothetical protein [Dactylosporangium salmoneum]|uniref:OmpA-like domain-containing protein n=1 Tax=Dactylosporangium salmoneum TaxID=53361 RepID=A0ABP5TQS3_9ACTN
MPMHRLAAVATALTLAAGATAGCSGGTQPGPGGTRPGTGAQPGNAFAVVVGAHANSPHPALVSGAGSLIDAAVAGGSRASIVVSDGQPSLKGPVSLAASGNNAEARKKSTAALSSSFAAKVIAARATAPENDLLGAISLAARATSGGTGTRTLLVIDSGLQTVAPLRFQDPGVLGADPADVAESLASAHALPDLKGVTVLLSGIGDTAAPQEPLSTAQRANLVAIWTAVLQRAGAEVTVRDEPLSGAAADGLPAVTTVTLPVAQTFATIGTSPTTTVDLGQETVAFLPDQAVYRDPAAVQQTLKPLAEKIIAGHLLVSLTGATAGNSDGLALSRQRAEAVKQTLVGLGVDPATITCSGLGSKAPGHVPDTDASGHLLPGPAAQNRKVIVEARRA